MYKFLGFTRAAIEILPGSVGAGPNWKLKFPSFISNHQFSNPSSPARMPFFESVFDLKRIEWFKNITVIRRGNRIVFNCFDEHLDKAKEIPYQNRITLLNSPAGRKVCGSL